MHLNHTNGNITMRATGVLVLVLAALLLAACGSSSKGTSSNAASTAPTTTGRGADRFAALRECLKKSGITLPERKSGQGRPPSGGGGFPLGGVGGGATKLPKGVTQAQFQADLRKCGIKGFNGRPGARTFGRVKSPAFQKALSKFAACLRENGIDVPSPNTSGKGPIFDTKGLNTNSSKFKAAQQKCSSLLRVGAGGVGGAAPPAGGSGGEGGAPPPAG